MNSDLIFKGQPHTITSPFGSRKDPFTGEQTHHNGVDYGTSGKKIPVYAVADGTVRINRFETGAGNYVSIGHNINGKDYRALYLHLDKLSELKVGAKVKKGDTVGIVGTTGRSTGIHLHFGWFDVSAGKHIDFEKFVFPDNDKYIVKAGDVLWKIAEQWGMNWEDVFEYNKSATFTDPSKLTIGQIILKPIQSDTDTKECQVCQDTKDELIKARDTLNRELEVYKDTVQDIDNKNDQLMIKNGQLKSDMQILNREITDLKEIISTYPKKIFKSPRNDRFIIRLNKNDKLHIKKQV